MLSLLIGSATIKLKMHAIYYTRIHIVKHYMFTISISSFTVLYMNMIIVRLFSLLNIS